MDNSKNYEYKLIKYRYLSNKNPNNSTYTYKIQKYQDRLQNSQQLHQSQIGGGLFDMFRKKPKTLEELQEELKKAIKDYSDNYVSKKNAYIDKMTLMIDSLLKTINIEDLKILLKFVEDEKHFTDIKNILEKLKKTNN